jgi:hypothetical protein
VGGRGVAVLGVAVLGVAVLGVVLGVALLGVVLGVAGRGVWSGRGRTAAELQAAVAIEASARAVIAVRLRSERVLKTDLLRRLDLSPC